MLPFEFDTEVYKNYFLLMVGGEDGRVGYVEKFNDSPLDIAKARKLLGIPDGEYYSFNGNHFDVPLIRLALSGATNAKLKEACDQIIKSNLKSWQFEKVFPVASLNLNHVDLFEVSPGMVSLKIYGGRMHCPKMQDLPIEPDATITPEQVPLLRHYCRNDLSTTRELRKSLIKQVDIRRTLRIGLVDELKAKGVDSIYPVDDLRSKSDAQISESVLKQRVFIATGSIPRKLDRKPAAFRYVAPPYIRYRSGELTKVAETMCTPLLTLGDNGHVKMPDMIGDLTTTIGASVYNLGVGGLHSQETSVSLYSDNFRVLKDIDVASYYPALMLNLGLYPDAMGPAFLKAYREIRDERILAKHSGDKVKANVLKITLNGAYGKTSSKYSILYSPKMTVYTTFTGQLAMLMLIEALELFDIPVVSANTDGIVVACPRDKEELQRKIVAAWEARTNLETEETTYISIHSRDVNNYIAVKSDGSVKRKGFFAESGLAKSPQNEICTDALVAFILHNTPVEKTIRECTDLRKFVSVRKVTGGAEKDGLPLGKAVRWYYATGTTGTINYITNGNTVPRSAGAKPCLDFPLDFPTDINYDWYIAEVNELLMDVGLAERPVWPKLPRRGTLVWKDLEARGLVEVREKKPCWAVALHEIPKEYV